MEVWISVGISSGKLDGAPISIKVIEFDSGVNTFIENKYGDEVKLVFDDFIGINAP